VTSLPILPMLLAVHVLSVMLWIGGLAFVTTVVLPALARLPAAQRIPAFLEIERRFGSQARVLVLVVGPRVPACWRACLLRASSAPPRAYGSTA